MKNFSIRLILATILLSYTTIAGAQEKKQVFTTPKFSGYMLGQYKATLKDGDNSNTFNLRMARVSVGGRILDDFEYKIQGQINGNTSTLGDSPRLVDMFVEWQKHKELRVKAGQFKRPFTFENPMNPIDQGFMGYGQAVNKLAGFSDRTGEHASNGRDIGVQIQGDVLPDASGRALLHYQVGVFNGQGINMSDIDNKKDIIGGAWVMPVKGLRIGAFGWVGSNARNGKFTDENGNEQNGIVSLNQYRYAISAEYKQDDMQLRAEYVHSTGYGFAKAISNSSDKSNAEINRADGNKADAFYALGIVPIIKNKLRAKARYDLYRKSASWDTSLTQYEVGLNYLFHKNLEVQCEYALIDNRVLTKNYSVIDVEFCVRF